MTNVSSLRLLVALSVATLFGVACQRESASNASLAPTNTPALVTTPAVVTPTSNSASLADTESARKIDQEKKQALRAQLSEAVPATPKISSQQIEAIIASLATETNTAVLSQMATTLSKTTTRGSSVRAAFRKLLQHPEADLREQTLMALEDYAGVSFMLDDIVPLLSDPSEDVRDSAITTIADYVEGRKKFDVLFANLNSPYEDVRDNIIFNLEFYTDQEFKTVEEWQTWWQENRNTFQP